MIRFDGYGYIMSFTHNYQVFLLLWWWCLIVAFIGFLRLIWRAAQCRSDGFPVKMMRPTLIQLQILMAKVPYDPHEDEQILQEIHKDGKD